MKLTRSAQRAGVAALIVCVFAVVFAFEGSTKHGVTMSIVAVFAIALSIALVQFGTRERST